MRMMTSDDNPDIRCEHIYLSVSLNISEFEQSTDMASIPLTSHPWD